MNHRWRQSCFSSSIDLQLLFITANVNKSYCLSHEYQLASYDSSHSNSYKNITCQLAYLEIQGQASCIKYINVHPVSLDHTLSIFLHSNLSSSTNFKQLDSIERPIHSCYTVIDTRTLKRSMEQSFKKMYRYVEPDMRNLNEFYCYCCCCSVFSHPVSWGYHKIPVSL